MKKILTALFVLSFVVNSPASESAFTKFIYRHGDKIMDEHSGNLSLEVKQARNFKEDAHRLKGKSGDYLVYKVEAPINSWKVYSFFPKDISDFKFSVSSNGKDFEQVKFDRKDYFVGKGEYDYYKPVLYNGAGSGEEAKYLKIEYTSQAQISCVEIKYAR